MRRLLITTVVILFLWSTTNITAYASTTLISTLFRTSLVKGEYVDEEVLKSEESVDDEPIDVAEEIITDRVEIAEPQESDEHGEITDPTDMGSAVDEEAGELGEPTQSEEPVDEQLELPENTEDSTEPEVETPIDSEEEEEHETEVQSTQ